MPSKETVISELHSLQEAMESILYKAKENAKISSENFVAVDIKQLGALIGLYYNALCNLGVKTREAMEALFTRYFRYQEFQACVDSLLETEANWDMFLKERDKEVYGAGDGEPELRVGSKGPLDYIVVDAESERYVDHKGM